MFGAELVDGSLAVRTSDYGAFTRIIAPTARDAGDPAVRGPPDRRLARERVQLPGAPMTRRRGHRPGHPARRCSAGGGRCCSGCWRRCRSSSPCSSGWPAGAATSCEILDTLVVRTILPLDRAHHRDRRHRLGDRGRDARLHAGQADPALADRPGQDGRRRGPDGRPASSRRSSSPAVLMAGFAGTTAGDRGRLRAGGRARRGGLRRGVHGARGGDLAGPPHRPGLHPALGGRPVRVCWRARASCRSGRRRSGWRPR